MHNYVCDRYLIVLYSNEVMNITVLQIMWEILSIVVIVVVITLVTYLAGAAGTKEKSFEQAIAEERLRNKDDSIKPKKTKVRL